MAFSTFKIFPLNGKIAWKARFCLVLQFRQPSRPLLKQFLKACGSLSEQSDNLPGNPEPPNTFYVVPTHVLFFAAIRAVGCITLFTIILASLGCSSK